MPFKLKDTDCLPLVFDKEYEIINEELLAEYVGKIILGHYSHVTRIIKSLSTRPLLAEISDLDLAIKKLDNTMLSIKDIEKRDGWVFQIISWLALFHEYKGEMFYCQQPHDAPAQHGLDGIAIVLGEDSQIESIIITEDKCTINHRVIIPKVWEEFLEFEKGTFNNKLVSRISALIENLDDGDILEANYNNIYDASLRKYRLGINRDDTYDEAPKKRSKLFKGFDDCVTGDSPHRRFGATLHKNDIRGWMELFCQKTITYLKNQTRADV